MKKLFLLTLVFAQMAAAKSGEVQEFMDSQVPALESGVSYSLSGQQDTIMTIDDIMDAQTTVTQMEARNKMLNKTWERRTFFNISLNSTKLSSKEFPSALAPFEAEYKADLSLGIQNGRSFDFHKKPLGNVVFLGLDFTWLDFNFSNYDAAAEVPAAFAQSAKNDIMPWHNKKMSFSYGMSLGPSITLYPFTSLNSEAANKVRLNLYFHVGYSVMATIIKDITKGGDSKPKSEVAFGHGLFTSFGASLTWNFVGIGYEIRNDNSIKMKHVSDDYGKETMKFKQKMPRFYIQFRF